MLPENRIVRGMWIGERLTPIQRLCVRSFQDAGHEFHLYVPHATLPPDGIPEGTILHSITEILPLTDRAKFTCDSHFSDWFRVNLIFQTGGFYVDMDEVCLKPFDFDDPYVFVSEFPDRLVNGCIFKAPAGCGPLKWAIDRIAAMDTLHPASWISVGPQIFRDMVREFQLEPYVQPPEVFDAMSPLDLGSFTRAPHFSFEKDAYAAHLRTSYWKDGLDPDGEYPGSAFAELRRKHGV